MVFYKDWNKSNRTLLVVLMIRFIYMYLAVALFNGDKKPVDVNI